MGLREKVALLLFFNTLLQISYRYCLAQNQIPSQNQSGVRKQTRNVDTATSPPIVITIKPQVQAAKARNKFSSDRNQESLQKSFNFPDVEYPTASTPRPPFYLQETNILQRNPMQRAADYPSSTSVQYPRNGITNDVHKSYNGKQKHHWNKTTKKPEVTFSEYGATPQPYYFRDEGAFPDVEYPLNARDTWKPNYWNQNPVYRPQNDINKIALNNSPNSFPSTKTSKSISKDILANSKKIVSKLLQAQSLSTNQNNVINNHHQPKKEELGKNQFTKTDSHPPKINEVYNNHHTTPAPSVSTQSTIPYVLTPYTTLYFDSTSPNTIESNHSNSENKSISSTEGKKRKKKKIRKKSSSSMKPSINDENDSLLGSLTTPMPKIIEADFHEQKDFAIPLITSEIECSNVRESETDTCPYQLNNTLLPTTSTTPSCPSNDTSLSMTIYNDDETSKITNDKTVALIPSCMNTVSNSDNEDLLYLNNNITDGNNSLILRNKTIEFDLSCHEDVIVVPTDEEEFTTDSIPDFDEDVLSMYNLSTSTLSPLNSIDNTWSNSKVIEFLSGSLLYPDELDQFYIMVP